MTTASAPKRRPRSKGRPDSAEGVGSDALLAATVEELRVTTPQALTLAGVAARAGVHPALIRYYFGGKDGLLTKAAQLLVEGEHDTVRAKVESDAPLDEKLSGRLRGMIDLVEANPHFHSLVLDKIYGQPSLPKDQSMLSRVTARGLTLTNAMLHDQDTSQVRDIDPRFLHIALIGLTQFFATAKPLLHEMFGDDADLDEVKERYVSFLAELITVGITRKS